MLSRGLLVRPGLRRFTEGLHEMVPEHLAEDHGLGQGVAAEPVRAVDPGSGLADGVEPLDGRPVSKSILTPLMA